MKTDLLESVLDLWKFLCEVLQSANNRAIEQNIRNRRTGSGGELGLRVDTRGRGFAMKHPSMVKKLMSILPLMKEEAIRTTHDLNTEEVVQRTQVLDGELSTKTVSEPTEKARCAGS